MADGVHRFRRWTRAGVWDRIFAAVQRQADAAGQLDWTVHFVDGTVVRAHQHAAGAKPGPRGDPAPEALGKSQGGLSTKVHLRAEGSGKPLTVLLTPGQRHEARAFAPLLEQGAVRRPGRRPRASVRAGSRGTRATPAGPGVPTVGGVASATPSPADATSTAPGRSIAPSTAGGS
jgi:Transposase DDE domain